VFWFDKYHLDGLRVDAVASMLYLDYSRKPGEWAPNIHGGRDNLEAIYFLRRLNEVVFERFAGVMMVAEESTAWPAVSRPTYMGGLGFQSQVEHGMDERFPPVHVEGTRASQVPPGHDHICVAVRVHENFVLVLSHDEVSTQARLVNKMAGDTWQRFANLRALLAFMYGHPGKKLMFMGTELGQWDEWNARQSLDWHLMQHEPHTNSAGFSPISIACIETTRLWEQDFGWRGSSG